MSRLYLTCPRCGAPAGVVIGLTQATCSNLNDDECDVILFNPSLPDGGLSHPLTLDEAMDVARGQEPEPRLGCVVLDEGEDP